MAMKLNNKVIVIVGLLVLAPIGCAMMFWNIGEQLPKPNVDIAHPMHFDVYSGGAIARSGDLSPESPVRTRLGKLLNDDGAKWERSFVSYAPDIAFRAEEYSIMLQQKRMIMNYQDSNNKAVQVTRDLPAEVFKEIQGDLAHEK